VPSGADFGTKQIIKIITENESGNLFPLSCKPIAAIAALSS